MPNNVPKPERSVLLERIAIEKDRAVSEFMRRMHLLQQQEAALAQKPEPQGPYVRMVRPKTRRAE
jgi:hypothetical protein